MKPEKKRKEGRGGSKELLCRNSNLTEYSTAESVRICFQNIAEFCKGIHGQTGERSRVKERRKNESCILGISNHYSNSHLVSYVIYILSSREISLEDRERYDG